MIEDEQDLADMVKVNLELAGYDVRIANDGGAGLAAARREPPDLVLLDVMMPVLDGWGVLERRRELGDETTVIVLSAKSEEADIARALELGAREYVVKPFDLDKLVALVQRVLAE